MSIGPELISASAPTLSASCIVQSSAMIPVMDLIPSLRTYEVIEPSEIRGLVFDGPDSTRVHPREMTVALQAFGVKYEIQLERVDDLFGAEYGHYSWDVDAARVVPPANHDDDDDDARRSIRRDHCHYRGVVRSAVPVGADVGDASLDRRSFHEAFTPTHTRVRASLCDGITARIVADDVVIHLEPAHRHAAGYPMRSDDPKTSPVVAYRDEDVREDAPRGMTRYAPRPRMTTVELDVDGVDRVDSSKVDGRQAPGDGDKPGRRPGTGIDDGMTFDDGGIGGGMTFVDVDVDGGGGGGGRGSRRRALASSLPNRYLELIVVNDKTRCDAFAAIDGSITSAELDAMHADSVAVVNQVAGYYDTIGTVNMEIVLVAQVDWCTGDPCSITAESNGERDADTLLGKFQAWHGANLASLPSNDDAHLFSGYDFKGNTIGLAGMGTICSKREYCGYKYNCDAAGVRRARRWLLRHDQRRPAVLLTPLAGLHIGGEHGQGHGGFRRGRRARDWPPDGLQPRRLVVRFRRGFLRGERLHHGRGERGRRERLVRLHQDQVQERHLRRQPRVSQHGRDDKVRQRDPRSRRAVRLRRVGLHREGRLLRRRDVPVHRRVRVLRDGRLLLELQGGRRRRRVQSRRELLLRRGGNLRRKRLQVPRRRREAPGNRVRGRQRR